MGTKLRLVAGGLLGAVLSVVGGPAAEKIIAVAAWLDDGRGPAAEEKMPRSSKPSKPLDVPGSATSSIASIVATSIGAASSRWLTVSISRPVIEPMLGAVTTPVTDWIVVERSLRHTPHLIVDPSPRAELVVRDGDGNPVYRFHLPPIEDRA